MENLSWGGWITLMGMGTVFLILLVLMIILYAFGLFDRPRKAKPTTPDDVAEELHAVVHAGGTNGLTDTELAAVVVAVLAHARMRRLEGAPEARLYSPGSQLYASRWVASGRRYDATPPSRRK